MTATGLSRLNCICIFKRARQLTYRFTDHLGRFIGRCGGRGTRADAPFEAAENDGERKEEKRRGKSEIPHERENIQLTGTHVPSARAHTRAQRLTTLRNYAPPASPRVGVVFTGRRRTAVPGIFAVVSAAAFARLSSTFKKRLAAKRALCNAPPRSSLTLSFRATPLNVRLETFTRSVVTFESCGSANIFLNQTTS